MKKKTADITVIGCGWLGLPLLRSFESEERSVQGTARSEQSLRAIQDAGGIPLYLELKEETIAGETAQIAECERAVICVPPSGAGKEHYPAAMGRLGRLLAAGPAEQVLMVSSISVYPDGFEGREAPVTPAPDTERGRRMWSAEQALREALGDRLTLLRLGGLAGPGRHPGRFLAGRKGLSGAMEPVNMIHLDDALGILRGLLRAGGGCYHAAAPGHPGRAEFYVRMAESGGFEPPEFTEEAGGKGRLIDPEIAASAAQHDWIFPDPMRFVC